MNHLFWNMRYIVLNRSRTKLYLPDKCNLVVAGNNLNQFIVMRITQKRKTPSSRVPFIYVAQNHNNYRRIISFHG
jgi:hypothetical protein